MSKGAPFAKWSSEAQQLHDMLVRHENKLEAEPGIIGKMFPTIVAGKLTASQIKGGAARVKREARSTLETMNRMNFNVAFNEEEEGKSLVDCFFILLRY